MSRAPFHGLPNAFKQAAAHTFSRQRQNRELVSQAWNRVDYAAYREQLDDEYAELKAERQAQREYLAELHGESLGIIKPLRFDAQDDEIRTLAEKMSQALAVRSERALSQMGGVPLRQQPLRAGRNEAELEQAISVMMDAFADASNQARAMGIEPPETDAEDPATIETALLKLSCAKWWRGQLRKLVKRRVSDKARRDGKVCKGAGLYTDDASLQRFRDSKQRNRDLLKCLVAVSDAGDEVSLEDLAESSISNPLHKMAELMVRMKGIGPLADERKDEALFVTPTLDSPFHAFIEKTGRVNQKWIAAGRPTIKQAQASAQRRWQLLRAYLAKNDIKLYGMRVTEPHHDGTPHSHMAVLVPKWARAFVIRAFWLYFLPTDADSTELFDAAEVMTSHSRRQHGQARRWRKSVELRIAKANRAAFNESADAMLLATGKHWSVKVDARLLPTAKAWNAAVDATLMATAKGRAKRDAVTPAEALAALKASDAIAVRLLRRKVAYSPMPYTDALTRVVRDAARLPGNRKRVKVERIRRNAQGVLDLASYMTKYLAKNLDAKQLEFRMHHNAESGGTVLSSEAPMTAAERAQCWASVNGIRQYQFFGLPAIGLWREARMIGKGKPIPDAPLIEAVRKPADESDYATHVRVLGGPLVPRKDLPVELWIDPVLDALKLPVLTRYRDGELARMRGIQSKPDEHEAFECVITRFHTWTVEHRHSAEADWSKNGPWTRVTNCNRAGGSLASSLDDSAHWAGARAGPDPGRTAYSPDL